MIASLKRFLIFLGLTLVWTTYLFGHGPDTLWTRTYGGPGSDRGEAIIEVPDGGYLILGATDSYGSGSSDMYLLKINTDGDTLWTKTYGGIWPERGKDIQATSDGAYIITGYSHSFTRGYSDLYLLKVDSIGDTIWTKWYGGDHTERGHSVQQTSDEGYIVAGYTKSYGAGEYDFYLLKTDANGDSLWAKTFGGTNADFAHAVIQTSDGGYIVVGETASFGAGAEDVYVVRTNQSGDSLWTRTYGGTSGDFGYDLIDQEDGFLIVGETRSYGVGLADIYVIRINAGGDTIWTKTIGDAGYNMARSIRPTSDENYILAGTIGGPDDNLYLVEMNSEGDSTWTLVYGGDHTDEGYAALETLDGGIIVVAYTSSFGAGGSDVLIVRTQPPNPDWAWLSADTLGFPMAQDVAYEREDTARLYIVLKNDSMPATEIVYPLSYDPEVFQLDSAEFNTDEFPNWPLWNSYSILEDTLLNDTGRILLYLSNGGSTPDALPTGVHRLASLHFVAAQPGGFDIDTCFYPPSFSYIYYSDGSRVDYFPVWTRSQITVYVVEPDIAISPESFDLVTLGHGIVEDSLWVYNWSDSSTLWVDSIANISAWLDVDDRSFSVSPLDTQLVLVTADGAGLNPGIYHDTLRIYSNDPDEPMINVLVQFTLLTTDDAWLSRNLFGDPILTELTMDIGDTADLHLMFRNVSDTAHAVVYPLCHRAEWLELLSMTFDSTTFPSHTLWNFTIDDMIVDDTAKFSFYAWTSIYEYGLPNGAIPKHIGEVSLRAVDGCITTIDTCEFPGHGHLSYVNGPSGITYWPEWQPVRVTLPVELCGDVNGNCQITTGDAFMILNYFGGGPQPISCWAANINGDDHLTTGDGFCLLGYFGSVAGLWCAECDF
jgi:hypothetical protein